MRLSVFLIIVVGLMFTFHLAGIETGSSNILTKVLPNQTTNINPSVGDVTTDDLLSSKNIWIAVIIAFVVIGAVTATRINLGVVQFQATTENIYSFLSLIIWGMFAVDFLSILKVVYIATGGIGWIFTIIFLLMSLFLISFAISLLNFVRGTD